MSRKREITMMGLGVLTGLALLPAAQAGVTALTATPSTQPIYVDGQRVSLEAYSIGGANYVKLRDIGQAVDFEVYWDGQAVQIEREYPQGTVWGTRTTPGTPLFPGHRRQQRKCGLVAGRDEPVQQNSAGLVRARQGLPSGGVDTLPGECPLHRERVGYNCESLTSDQP